MGLSPIVCLRIRITLYIIFALSYAVGAYIFVKHFHNHLAAFGFTFAVIFIIFASILHLIPDGKLYLALPTGSLKRIAFQTVILIISSAFFGAGVYALVQGIKLRQAWTGESYFCSLIALLTASKWCFFCGYRVFKVRHPYSHHDMADDDEEEEEEENEKVVEEGIITKTPQ